MTIYDVGDAVQLATSVTDVNGAAIDASMALLVTKPDGSTTAPTIVHPGTGSYTATLTADQAGTWLYRWTASGAVTAVDSGQFSAADPAPLIYASVADLRARMDRTDTETPTADAPLISALLAASRDVDEDCGRRFYLDRTVSQRVLNPQGREFYTPEGYRLIVDDIGSTTGLIVEVGTTTGGFAVITDFETVPDNAAALGRPVTSLLRQLSMWSYWPLHRIRVTAQWGWPRIPPQIAEATLIRAQRLYRRRASPEGVAGFNDMGVVRVGRYDPDYDRLVAPFKLPGFG